MHTPNLPLFCDQTNMVRPATGAVYTYGSKTAKCTAGMCQAGHSCKYDRNSIWCDKCLTGAIGDGLSCTPCKSGYMPNENASSCMACPPGRAGREGVCTACGGNMIAASTSVECLACPKGMAPNEAHAVCVCADNYYNASRHAHPPRQSCAPRSPRWERSSLHTIRQLREASAYSSCGFVARLSGWHTRAFATATWQTSSTVPSSTSALS